jgi:hypothetical protein
MKRFTRAVVVTMVAMFTLAAFVSADHSSSLSFSKNPANTGDVVTVTATAIGMHNTPPANGAIRLDICQVKNEDSTWGVYAAAADCQLEVGDAEWRDLSNATVPANSFTSSQFDTATTTLPAVGFRSRYTPDQGHDDTVAVADLTILYPSTGNGHPGCNGIENAYDQVTTNNGAVQGKGNSAKALAKVAEKLGCELGE